jgi:hypothetical protein
MGNPAKKSMLFVLLDESGSMSGMEGDVIGGVNKFIEDQRLLPDPAVLAIGVFGSHIQGMIKLVRPMTDLREVRLLTGEDYKPTGGTPLLDATGRSIQGLDSDWLREKPDRCIFVTFTDGMENASKEFSKDKIKSLIQSREKSGLWQFLFLGANIDAFAVGGSMGYTSNKMSNYVGTGIGTRSASYKMSQTVETLRNMDTESYAAAAAGIGDIGLGGDIAEDGTVSKVTAASHPGFGAFDAAAQTTKPSSTPPEASMQPEAWKAQDSSALFDPKMEAWKPPV